MDMSAIEIKGNFLNFLANIEDSSVLQKMLTVCMEIARTEGRLDDMPPEVLAELEEAVKRSYDDKNLIPHEAVQKEMTQWLKGLPG
jgi:hypothetical protein